MAELQSVGPENWREFVTSPGTAVLVIGKNDCEACNAWGEELAGFLAGDEEFGDVRFGKIDLKQRGLIEFKKENTWLAEIEALPHNVIYRDGEIVKQYAGSGIDRLSNRLRRL
jgi:hypothetical protein